MLQRGRFFVLFQLIEFVSRSSVLLYIISSGVHIWVIEQARGLKYAGILAFIFYDFSRF